MGHLLGLLEVLCRSPSVTADCWHHHFSRHGVVPLAAERSPDMAGIQIQGQWVRPLDGASHVLVDTWEAGFPFQKKSVS